MAYYLSVGICCFIFTIGLKYLKRPFFDIARNTTKLLDILLNNHLSDEEKQSLLIKTVASVLAQLGMFILILVAVAVISIIPLFVFVYFTGKSWGSLDYESYKFLISMVLGSLLILLIPRKTVEKDYSEWSVLLHNIALNNYNISRALFNLERKIFLKKSHKPKKLFFIVSGLARAGTTALTSILYETGRFHALTYANMPFLLSVRIWRLLYRPSRQNLKERSHGDQTLFGYSTTEALEEYFFKVFLNDSYVTTNLTEHEIDEDVYNAYLEYQALVGNDRRPTYYLTKNNNVMLRYKSIREKNKDFVLILLFRNPLEHTKSLLRQHLRFTELQRDDPFVLKYMNWLGHHEFGLSQKPFQLGESFDSEDYPKDSLNYWYAVWINYYSAIISLLQDRNLILVEYQDLLENPNGLIKSLGKCLDMKLLDSVEKFNKKEISSDKTVIVNDNLVRKAEALYTQLVHNKLSAKSTLHH